MATAIFYDLENFKSSFMSKPIDIVINKMEKLIHESPITDTIILRHSFQRKYFSYKEDTRITKTLNRNN